MTEHFTFEELTTTTHTDLLDANRGEAREYMKQLKYNAGALEEVRAILGVPLIVTNGFRGELLNTRVRGSRTSTHRDGTTSDVVPKGMPIEEAFNILLANKDKLDSVKKIIIEAVKGKRWLHIEAKRLAKEPTVFYSTVDGINYTKVT